MKLSLAFLALVVALTSASPIDRRQLGNLLGLGNDPATQDAIDQLTQTFDRNNPNGTPVGPGNEDDLNGDGVINAFEAGAQVSRRSPQRNIIQQLQDTFDRNNPNGTPVGPGNEDDLNGDGVINIFEAGAQVSRRSPRPQRNIIQQLQDTFDRNNPNGTPVGPGNEDDLNGDGVINIFEAGAQVS